MFVDFEPVRMPKRRLTPEQVAKFAALREEIENELIARRAGRVADRPRSGALRPPRRGRWSWSTMANERPRG